jgi:SAM-dependent methyltransferase
MRDLVGGLELAYWDNPSREPIYPYLPTSAYQDVFDFGCGCGRVARQLIQQRRRPRRYLGVDLHRGMIAWCEQNLTPHAPAFRFEHHDVYNAGLNPAGAARMLPLPADAQAFSLFNAWSVFTHLNQEKTEHYLGEAARLLRSDGYLHATWFLFDKSEFPMMQAFQNALFINETDPSNAVIFDRRWLRETAAAKIRGFHWLIVMRPQAAGCPEIELPSDDAPTGFSPPPLMPLGAERIR